MIKNEKQYKITKKSISEFEKALEQLRNEHLNNPNDLQEIQISALESQYNELTEELEKYENLKNGNFNVIETKNFYNIHEIIIEARIASNLTQKQLAEKLGLKEQQIQRYESEDFANASYARLQQICEALHLKLWFEKIILISSTFSLPEDVDQESMEDLQQRIKDRRSVFVM